MFSLNCQLRAKCQNAVLQGTREAECVSTDLFVYSFIQEIQKPTKRKYTKKPRPVAPPQPLPQAEPSPPSPPRAPEPPTPDFSPERRMECYSASLLDHEYTAGPGPFGPGGPRGSAAMAPGVFLTSRRPSLSPQNSSTYSPSAASTAGLASPGSIGACGGKYTNTTSQHIDMSCVH